MTFNNKPCVVCRKKIKQDKKGVLLATFNNGSSVEKKYFHFKCYIDWFNNCAHTHAEEIIDKSAEKAFKFSLKKLPSVINGIFNNGSSKGKNSLTS